MIVHNPDNLPTAPIADLLPSQGNLKDLSDRNYKKLKNNIESRGFLIPVYTWVDPKYTDVIRKRWVKYVHGEEALENDKWIELTPAIE